MRLLHLITDLHVGGAETMLVRLVELHRHMGIDSHIIALTGGGPLAPELRRLGVEPVELGIARGRLPGLAALRLCRLARAARPDVVQGWMYHGNLAASFARRAAGLRVPLAWNVQNTLAPDASEKPLTRAVVRLGARLSRGTDAIVYCSKTSAREHEAAGYCAPRSRFIPNGTDGERFRPDPEARSRLGAELGIADDVTLIGMLARYHPMKDHPNLLRALRRALDLGPRLHLLLAGEGVDEANPRLMAAIAAAGLLPHVTLLGRRADAHRLVPGLDLLALPSAFGEAFPLVLGEAMASGVPCVATDLGDNAEILGDTGRIVPPRNPERLAAAVCELASLGTSGRRELGSRARARALERFALLVVARQYAELYRRLCASQRPGVPVATAQEAA